MWQSLSLAAYMAWARRGPQTPTRPTSKRPKGALIWAHATSRDHANALTQLAGRLAGQRPGLHMLLTTTDSVSPPYQAHPAVIHQPLPQDSVAAVDAFLNHWAPDLCLWSGGNLRPAMVSCTYKRAIALFLVDADESRLLRSTWRWLPDLPKPLLSRFTIILARNVGMARQLQRMRLKNTRVELSGPLQEGAIALPHNEPQREKMAGILRGRPVWLAAMIRPDELDTVLRAHRAVSRLAHRLFLVLVPDDLAHADLFRAELRKGGWRYTVWSEGEEPQETTQIVLADTRGEMGLWYRLATITLMGNSLESHHSGQDPNEPAAHGSAILYGPNVSHFLSSYSRYAKAGAARVVQDCDTLSAALTQLIAADQSAEMAHAAWDVASSGAEVMDRIAELVQDQLDQIGAG